MCNYVRSIKCSKTACSCCCWDDSWTELQYVSWAPRNVCTTLQVAAFHPVREGCIAFVSHACPCVHLLHLLISCVRVQCLTFAKWVAHNKFTQSGTLSLRRLWCCGLVMSRLFLCLGGPDFTTSMSRPGLQMAISAPPCCRMRHDSAQVMMQYQELLHCQCNWWPWSSGLLVGRELSFKYLRLKFQKAEPKVVAPHGVAIPRAPALDLLELLQFAESASKSDTTHAW